MFVSSSRNISRFCSTTRWKMFLLVSVRHVGTHPYGHLHGVPVQISINFGKTFLPTVVRKSSDISYTKYFSDLNLGESLCTFTSFHFPDSVLFYICVLWIKRKRPTITCSVEKVVKWLTGKNRWYLAILIGPAESLEKRQDKHHVSTFSLSQHETDRKE